jgi:hypothetical protein
VAGDELIENYLDDLAAWLRWRPDAAEVVDELRDHLLSASEAARAAGRSSGDAQREAIERVGRVEAVATELLTHPGVRLAVPTRFTHWAGVAGWCAAIAWLVAAGGWWGSVVVERRTEQFSSESQLLYVVGAGGLWLAAILTAVVVAAVCRRQGDRTWRARLALAFAVAGVAVTAMPWVIAGWLGLFAVAGLVVLASSWRTRVLPRRWLVAFGVAWAAAGLTWLVLQHLEVGWRDEWGGYPIVHAAAVSVGAVLIAVGCAGLGHRLVAERPVSELSPG